MQEPLLKLAGIGRNFGPVQALADIDLDIPAGQVTALVADNGAGKTTLIKCISGIHRPDTGQIYWMGRPVRLHSPHDAAALGIATVYQDLAPCDNLDIVQNMFLGRESLRHWQLDEISMELTASRTLSDLSVMSVRSIRQPVGSLSGGQRQGVAVARAVMQDARLVIMDEPTAALRVTQTRVVLDLIGTLAHRNIAVVVISHNLTTPWPSTTEWPCCTSGASPRSGRRRSSPADDRRADDDGRDEPDGTRARGGPVSTELQPAQEPPNEAPPDTLGQPGTATAEAAKVAAPEIIADSLGEYARIWFKRLRSGESGALPVLIGLIAIIIYFQVRNSLFLSAGNRVNLLIQGAPFIILGMAEVFVLLLGEIDLSIGFNAAIGAVFTAWLAFSAPGGWRFWQAWPSPPRLARSRERSSPASGCPRSW